MTGRAIEVRPDLAHLHPANGRTAGWLTGETAVASDTRERLYHVRLSDAVGDTVYLSRSQFVEVQS